MGVLCKGVHVVMCVSCNGLILYVLRKATLIFFGH
jgi:hypothetical protein